MNSLNQPNQWFKCYHNNRYVIERVGSCSGMEHFVNSVANYLMNCAFLILDVP